LLDGVKREWAVVVTKSLPSMSIQALPRRCDLGGRITVESQPGEGSCFSVWLPREAIPNAHPEDDGIADAAAGVAPTGQRLHRH